MRLPSKVAKILVGEILRRQNKDGDVPRHVVFPDSPQNLEAIHLRHKQIEKDGGGRYAAQHIEGLASAGCE